MARGRGGTDRYLTTVLFTDIVESTRRAAELGDRAWRDLVEQHNQLIRRQLKRFGGREVDTAGDGFFAAFDAPARAVACALVVVDQMPELGLEVRAGIHTGEVEEAGGKLRGIAVHIGSRIGATADAGEVLVSATVRDLVAGTAVEFEDRGTHQLKGVTGDWHLYAAERAPRFADEFGSAGESAGRDVAAVRRSVALRARRRRLAVVSASVAALAVLATGTYLVLQPPPSLAGIGANSAGLIDVASGRILAEVPVGGRPDGIAFGEGAVWVANHTDGTVSRIDAAKRAVVQTVAVGSGPGGIATGFGSVWVANGEDRTVSRINAATNRVVQTITVGTGPSGVATGAGAVWVTNGLDGTVTRIDPDNGTVTATYDVGGAPGGIAVDVTGVWVASFDLGTVTRIDPSTGSLLIRVPVGNGPSSVAIAGGAVWVTNELDDTVTRVDATTGRVSATLEVGRGPTSISVAGNGSLWVTTSFDGAVYRIDPATLAIARFATGSAPQALAGAGDQVWLSARASATSHRGGTLRLVGSAVVDSVDPALGFDPITEAVILSITNDGLVAFQRTGGFAGAAIVPDLAVSVPQPTEGGHTYTFQVRSGLTYSDGQPIVASDFRRAIERVYAVPPTSDDAIAGAYYEGIRGASDCATHIGQTCDLSAGIVADDAAGTVTFHLDTPDPDFLHKLALASAVATPAGVSNADIGLKPLPATGAYMVASITPTEVHLVRNPRFHEWSRLARPDGYPDEIIWGIGSTGDEQLETILGGSVDAMTLELPPPNHDRLAQLRTQFPAQAHATSLGTAYLWMNTSLRPFDDARVRQAVNFAIDRGKFVDLSGGDVAARVTCQVLASNLPGYSPYCPYTVNPNPGGTWTGPDLAAARELIATAQPSSKELEIVTFGRFAAATQSIADSLDQIGFATSVRVVDQPGLIVDELLDPIQGPRVQAAVLVWIPDISSTLDQIYPIFRCGDELNFARYCDDSISQAVQHALDVQQADPSEARQAWAAADRTIVDLAPAAPLVNIVYTDFVGPNVGNYQSNPQLGPLYDQFWVK